MKKQRDLSKYIIKNSDKILGATIVASHAGEMISEITLAMVNNIGLNGISKVIHSYPTQAEAIKKSRRCLPSHIINPSVSSNTQITEQVDLKVRDLESKKISHLPDLNR